MSPFRSTFAFSTCAAAAAFIAAGAAISRLIAITRLDPTRLSTSSMTLLPAARACALLSARPTAAAATAAASTEGSSSAQSPSWSARSVHASASAFPSPLIFPASSTILSATTGRVFSRPAAMAQASSAPAAAARTEGFESPICRVISPASPWPWRRSATAGPIAAAALPAIASAFAARILLLSANRFPSAGIRSPVLGAMRNPASARMPPTHSTAAARFFQLASPMSAMSFSVTSAETSARGRPSLATGTEEPLEPPLELFRTTRVTFSVTSNGFLANSTSTAFICASLSSPRKSRKPGPTPACMAPSAFAAAALHAGFVRPSDALHQSMTCGMPQACTPNSPRREAQKRSASEVTLGFLWLSALRRRRAKTNDGPSASETLVNAFAPGPRSLTSASFSATATTTRAPSRSENAGALAASDPSASNALPNTWKFLSSNPGVAASARTVCSAAASHADGDIASMASATVAMPARRSFQAPDASCRETSAP
mmetsp:Transcript_8037/g.33598  ORF Transcript_8037/g.33598 Transcript_8037/m.33598 type:complete len:490 (-) Transcript_8037:66-1535(-)